MPKVSKMIIFAFPKVSKMTFFDLPKVSKNDKLIPLYKKLFLLFRRSDNIEIMFSEDNDDIIEQLFESTYKYLCGYLNNDVIQPLCVILPQMHGYIKYFDNGGKNMTFVTDNEKLCDKYNEMWEVIRKLLKVKFAVNPVRDDKYLVVKLKIFNKINRTTFNNENNIPIERSHYICIPAID